MTKIYIIIWSLYKTIILLWKHGLDADKVVEQELHEERMKYWKITGKHWMEKQ